MDQSIEREHLLSAAAILLCGLCVAVFLNFYFDAWGRPYMAKEVADLSEGWEYETESMERTPLATLRSGPSIRGGETMTLCRALDTQIANAAILIRANHQAVNAYLDGAPLYLDRDMGPGENPGMALHYILLPEGYLDKTLKIELTSPYAVYSGRTAPIMLGPSISRPRKPGTATATASRQSGAWWSLTTA